MRIFTFLLVLSAGCAWEVPPEERVVVEIADRAFTVGEFEAFVARSVRQDDDPFLADAVTEALFGQFIEEQLMLKAADDAGIAADPKTVADRLEALGEVETDDGDRSETGALRSTLEKQVRIEKLVETRFLGDLAVTEDEITEHYETNRAYYERPETVEISQILVEERGLADELLRELRAHPKRFEELAKERSVGPEARLGGRLGRFGRGELPPSFEEVVFSMRKGRISEVVVTDFGFHIFRVDDKTDAESLDLDMVRDSIRVELLREKSERELARFIEKLKTTYPVTVHREHLSFAFLDWEDGRTAEAELEDNP